MERTETCELTMLCLIYRGREILLQNRVKRDWAGYTLPGGHVEPGESFVEACIREMREETGLILDPQCGRCVLQYRREEAFVDVWLFRQEFDLEDVILLEGETCDKMRADIPKILALQAQGQLVPFPYLQQLFDMV